MGTAATTPAAPAAAAAPVATPAAAPASAPVTAPVETTPAAAAAPVTPVAAPAETTQAAEPQPWQSKLDRSAFQSQEDYTRALVKERMDALNSQLEAPDKTEPPAAEVEPPKPADASQEAAPAAQQPEFDLEPELAITPEAMSQMAKDNPEFQKLLDSDPKLKNSLYKTAREAAEVKAWKAEFPDLQAAKSAKERSATFVDVREKFMQSVTPEGAAKALDTIAELCYERDEKGNVVMENGRPVIGDDFFGFVENTVKRDLEYRLNEVKDNLSRNRYASDEERDADERRQTALEVLMEDFTPASTAQEHDLPEGLKQRAAELDRREQALRDSETAKEQQARVGFEREVVGDAATRIQNGIKAIFESVKRQGGIISPYLERVLPNTIGSKLSVACEKDLDLKTTMKELSLLKPSADAKTRRLEVIDRAIQNLLPEIARTELQEAGIQWTSGQQTKREKIAAQEANTNRTEPRGSTSQANPAQQQPMSAEAAWKEAESRWSAKNPGRSVRDPGVKDELIRITQRLMLGQNV
jgi:hypothetical protein